MTKEEALKKVKGYLTDYISADCYGEVEEIMAALEQEPTPNKGSAKQERMRLRTKEEQKAYLDGFERCAESIKQHLSDKGKDILECQLMAVRSAVETDDNKVTRGQYRPSVDAEIRAHSVYVGEPKSTEKSILYKSTGVKGENAIALGSLEDK